MGFEKPSLFRNWSVLMVANPLQLFHLAEGIKRPWTMKREMLTPSYTTHWNQLPEVK